jgi:hypothetical protein
MSGEPPLLVPFAALKKSYGIDLSRDTIRRLARAGCFPQPRRLGGHRIAFLESEILEWVKNLPVAGSRTKREGGGHD